MTQEDAEAAINVAGLTLGVVSHEINLTVAQGTVLSQSPAPAAIVAPGYAVNLVVAVSGTPVGYQLRGLLPDRNPDHDLPNPNGIRVDSLGRVLVLCSEEPHVRVFESEGTLADQWGASGTDPGQLEYPRGMATGPGDRVYVAMSGRVSVYEIDGTFVGSFGEQGTGDGQFGYVIDIAVAADGTVYVVDNNSHRVVIFDATGAFISNMGSVGENDGQFMFPHHVTVDLSGHVYVADTRGRIQKFTSAGVFVDSFGSLGSGPGQFKQISTIRVAPDGFLYAYDSDTKKIQKWTTAGVYQGEIALESGYADGQIAHITSFALASTGVFYLADTSIDTIHLFDQSGGFVENWGWSGSDADEFMRPRDVAVAPDGHLFVIDRPISDTLAHRIVKIAPSGDFVGTFGESELEAANVTYAVCAADGSLYCTNEQAPMIMHFDAAGALINSWGGLGDSNGQFGYIGGIAVAPDGLIYVADSSNDRVQVFEADGTFVRAWGESGTGAGQLFWPMGVAVAPDGTVCVTDDLDRIQRFTGEGVYKAGWGEHGDGPGQFNWPADVAVGPTGLVFVLQSNLEVVQVFTPLGELLTTVGSPGRAAGQLRSTRGIDVGPDNVLYVAGRSRITVFEPIY